MAHEFGSECYLSLCFLLKIRCHSQYTEWLLIKRLINQIEFKLKLGPINQQRGPWHFPKLAVVHLEGQGWSLNLVTGPEDDAHVFVALKFSGPNVVE